MTNMAIDVAPQIIEFFDDDVDIIFAGGGFATEKTVNIFPDDALGAYDSDSPGKFAK